MRVLVVLGVALVVGGYGVARVSATGPKNVPPAVTTFQTIPDGAHLFAQPSGRIQAYDAHHPVTIEIHRDAPRQEIAGFGFAVTGGSASHLRAMSAPARAALLEELFGQGDGSIGMSLIRISLGASDLETRPFSYNENPDDLDHEGFSLGPHLEHLIPVLQEILAVNPDLEIMASPWSAPSWMKTNGSFVGGSLAEEYRDAYAAYIIKYLEVMDQYGIQIDYLTVQNEPLYTGNNPSMYMSAQEQAIFIRDHLGPAMMKSGQAVRLVGYDHNADRIDYPLRVLADDEAATYLDGFGFHLYGGTIDALSGVHYAHPNKSLYFTEQWYGADGDFASDFRWHMRNVIIGSMRNWCRAVIEWNLSSNPDLEPHTPGGCDSCLGAITLDGDLVTRNAGYYVIAHASKFVRPGSVYLPTDDMSPLLSAAFLAPGNKMVLIVLNDSDEGRSFNVQEGEHAFSTTLAGGAAATFVWDAN
jgi:glucosylceramidase